MPGLEGNASAHCGTTKVVPFPTGQTGPWSPDIDHRTQVTALQYFGTFGSTRSDHAVIPPVRL